MASDASDASDRGSSCLAVSMGDPAGIGPDIIIGAWLAQREAGLPPFLVIGDPNILSARAAALKVELPLAEADCGAAAGLFAAALPVFPIHTASPVTAGKPDPANADMVTGAIRKAVDLAMSGSAGGVVTAPIAKSVLYEAGFAYPGHTEFLAALAGEATGRRVRPVMLLANAELKVAPVTIHIPLADVPGALTLEAIVETARIMAQDLGTRFGIERPRLAISGLNPHAGENGALGSEDEAIIVPAIAQLQAEGILAVGPLPADTMFHAEARAGYDAAICMYHDQALIPAKTLGFHDGVNVTLGLPFIRTSPDHGTAFGLAGTGKARADSMIAALRMAGRMAGASTSASKAQPA